MTTDKDKQYKGRPCKCGHIRGLHRLLAYYVFIEDEDTHALSDDGESSASICICGCPAYDKMDNLTWVERAARAKGLV